jgi:hypothetical protein
MIPIGLQTGSKGTGVVELFHRLFTLGFLGPVVDEPSELIQVPLEVKSTFSELHKEGVKYFQLFYNLPITGVVDKKTAELLNMRCCRKATIDFKTSKPLAFTSGPATLSAISYFSFVDTAENPLGDVTGILQDALNQWGGVVGTTWAPGHPSIVEVSFQRGEHGDGNPFDGESGILAHSWSLIDAETDKRGLLHFDADELWNMTYDFHTMAVHEAGHIHGLDHTSDTNSVMYPFVTGIRRVISSVDVQMIKELYGGGY